MMIVVKRFRYSVAAAVVLAIYVVLNCDWLLRHFKAEDMLVYFTGLASVLIVSSFLIKDCAFWLHMLWAVFAPVVGSVVGYGCLAIFSWVAPALTNNPVGMTLSEWLFLGTIGALTMAKVWMIPAMLLVFCGFDGFFFRRVTKLQGPLTH